MNNILNSLIKESFNKPKNDTTVLVESISKQPQLIGTAFDYLLRFRMERLGIERNIKCLTHAWVAEQMVQTSVTKKIITNARNEHDKYINTGKLSTELIELILQLAMIDNSYQESNLNTIYQEDINDIKKLNENIDPEIFHANTSYVLNPIFESGSLIGGAEGDLIIDDALIDIKVTKDCSFKIGYLYQLISYYLCHCIDCENRCEPVKIKKIGIYFARQANLVVTDIESILKDGCDLNSILSEFKKIFKYIPPSNFRTLSKVVSKNELIKRRTPYPHQNIARKNVINGFDHTDRGQMIMACGTGKTYTSLLIKEDLRAQLTLVLVPSLGLLSQLLRAWTNDASVPFDSLCVCSDQSAGNPFGKTDESDENEYNIADLGFPVTTDVVIIKEFMMRVGNKVVFSTYHSSPLIAEVQRDIHVPAFDFSVADEAHHCAGKSDRAFTTIMDDQQIRSKKRLFATATPRIYSSKVISKDYEDGVEVLSMDNVKNFGKVLHKLSFGEAISKGLLSDYQVVIIGIDDTNIISENNSKYITKPVSKQTNLFDDLNTISEVNCVSNENGNLTESVARQIGLLKAMKDYDLRRVVTFHSRVNKAASFAGTIRQVASLMEENQRPSGNLFSGYVAGYMETSIREGKINQLREINDNDRCILSNVRCLSEGVDVPALDCVAFMDPKSNQSDIIQATGRAIRLSKGKTIGTIVIPVIIKKDKNAEDIISSGEFRDVYNVVNALRSHDDELEKELEECRTNSRTKFSNKKIIFNLPSSIPKHLVTQLTNALNVQIVKRTASVWDEYFELLKVYVKRNKHLPKYNYCTKQNIYLGDWVYRQQKLKDTIVEERKGKLESLQYWEWSGLDVGLDNSDWAIRESNIYSVYHNKSITELQRERGLTDPAWQVRVAMILRSKQNFGKDYNPDKPNRLSEYQIERALTDTHEEVRKTMFEINVCFNLSAEQINRGMHDENEFVRKQANCKQEFLEAGYIRERQNQINIIKNYTFRKFFSHDTRNESYSTVLNNDKCLIINSEYYYILSAFKYPAFITKTDKKGTIHELNFRIYSINFSEDLKNKINSIDLNLCSTAFEATQHYKKFFGDNLLSIKIKILAYPKERLHNFYFGYKDKNETLFKFKPDQIYEVFGYELMFLKEYEYEILEMYLSIAENLFDKDILYNKNEFSNLTDRFHQNKNLDIFNYTKTIEYEDKINLIYTQMAVKPRYYKNPVIKVFTLSHVRFLIHFYQKKVIDGGGSIKYTNADLIVCDEKGYNILENLGVLGTDLGQFSKININK